ncbi:hypothetical protein GCM10023200_53760 [Actinomycetospora chlora]|uniref:Uncharacterized protein n=1 Tax=Actinomycetospora chlora TaxID=663608 RepID=A0ABP9CE75_9PSEU
MADDPVDRDAQQHGDQHDEGDADAQLDEPVGGQDGGEQHGTPSGSGERTDGDAGTAPCPRTRGRGKPPAHAVVITDPFGATARRVAADRARRRVPGSGAG